jgi:FlaG/FlaF family flagellin (archaellin)
MIVILVLVAAALAGCGGGSSSDKSTSTAAASLTSCNINGKQQNLGASYVTSIQVAKVSCDQAEKLVVAYHHCRMQNGGPDGTCSAVQGFTCTEGPRQTVPGVQFNGSADCRKGDAEVKSTYTQNL